MPRHQTVHKELKHAFSLLTRHQAVKKVIVGRFENCRHSWTPGHIRIRPTETGQGMSIDGYSGSGIQRFEVYLKLPNSSEDRSTVREYIEHISR